jgi:apolipoprotein N-acyltransferase
MKNFIKNVLVMVVGGGLTACGLIAYEYIAYTIFGKIPPLPPSGVYDLMNSGDTLLLIIIGSIMTTTFFCISFFFTVKNRSVNRYLLGLASGLYFILYTAFGNFIDTLPSILSWSLIFILGVSVNLLFFRRDLMREVLK